jgi:hypothetical protein
MEASRAEPPEVSEAVGRERRHISERIETPQIEARLVWMDPVATAFLPLFNMMRWTRVWGPRMEMLTFLDSNTIGTNAQELKSTK